MEMQISGVNAIEIIDNSRQVIIPRLFPFKQDGHPFQVDDIVELLTANKINFGYDKNVIDFWLKKARTEERVLEDVMIAHAKDPLCVGSDYFKFDFTAPYTPFDILFWETVREYFQERGEKSYFRFSYPLRYVQRDEKIGIKTTTKSSVSGKSIYGEELPAKRNNTVSFQTGENVIVDARTQSFFAEKEGFLVLDRTTIHVIQPFLLSPDNMRFYYLNILTLENRHPKEEFMKKYMRDHGIATNFLVDDALLNMKPHEHKLLAEGKDPIPGIDAKVEYHFQKEKSVGKMDEKGRLNFKEKDFFISTEKGQVLAVKTKAIPGKPGLTLLDKLIVVPSPRDAVLNYGQGTRVEENDEEMKILADTEGILEYKRDSISVYPTAIIRGDVNLESGNIRTNSNVEIHGTVLAGFEVISAKNITIYGNIEDNCVVKAKGDILVKGGVIGESVRIDCGGNLQARYISGGVVTCQGDLMVERFLLGANIECHQKITVLGHHVNFSERGSIVDCNISVRTALYTPAIGSQSGLMTRIHFAYDEILEARVLHLQDTLSKINADIIIIKSEFDIDIGMKNLGTRITGYPQEEKEKIITAVQEMKRLKKKYKMIEDVFHKEEAKLKELLKASYVKIIKKVYPPLELVVSSSRKKVGELMGPSRYYYDYEEGTIKRSQFVSESQTV